MDSTIESFGKKLHDMANGKAPHTWFLQSPHRNVYVIVSLENEKFNLKYYNHTILGVIKNLKFKNFCKNEGFFKGISKHNEYIVCSTYGRNEIAETFSLVRRYFSAVHKLDDEIPIRYTGINV